MYAQRMCEEVYLSGYIVPARKEVLAYLTSALPVLPDLAWAAKMEVARAFEETDTGHDFHKLRRRSH